MDMETRASVVTLGILENNVDREFIEKLVRLKSRNAYEVLKVLYQYGKFEYMKCSS